MARSWRREPRTQKPKDGKPEEVRATRALGRAFLRDKCCEAEAPNPWALLPPSSGCSSAGANDLLTPLPRAAIPVPRSRTPRTRRARVPHRSPSQSRPAPPGRQESRQPPAPHGSRDPQPRAARPPPPRGKPQVGGRGGAHLRRRGALGAGGR